MWPVTIVIALLTLCFLVPGLASIQTVEALLGYVRFGAAVEIVWIRYIITLGSTILLGAVLRSCSRRLLSIGGQSVPPSLAIWLSRSSGYLPLAAIAFGFFSLRGELSVANPFGVMAAGLLIVYLLQDRFQLLTRWFLRPNKVGSRGSKSNFGTVGWFTTFVLVALLFAFSERDATALLPFSLIQVSQTLGPINILFLACCLWTEIATSLVILSRKTRIPLVGAVACVAIITNVFALNDNHPIRRNDESNRTDDVQPAFGKWLGSRPDRKDFPSYPVLLVSAEGGGIRAAYFTAVTLARIVDSCPRSANHIFAISGVSGGAIGAAIFAAAMKARPPDPSDARCDLQSARSHRYEDAVSEVLSDDHLSPLLIRMLTGDAFQQALPFSITNFDRQLGLEFSLERSFLRVFKKDVLSEPLYGFAPSVQFPSIPFLFLNTTRVEDGLRVTFSPLYFRTEQYGGADDWHAVDYLLGPPISAAAGTSARFPLISPPGYFVSRTVKQAVVDGQQTWVPDTAFVGKKNRYVDGGYFDNSGAPTLLELYRELNQVRGIREDVKFYTHILHIGNYPTCEDTKKPSGGACKIMSVESARSGLITDLESVYDAIFNVRSTRADYGLKQLFNEVLRVASVHANIEMTDHSGTDKQYMERALRQAGGADEEVPQYAGFLFPHSDA
ncbi:hypothetical protein [Bradyrhizobium sp. NAS96.2]|uniref:hypothetical protein n=1 Tax=Bradyrhizobium sp. NAS96.2 TaxID=1680160 RepID=UPI00093C59FC|nr:hypothetical protein [Bradyrhizobium sp. NAS96.2]OKO72127.1 hypothetical protein AC628_26835 [Bradyrhizobium sp. NAS96.2]